MAADSSGAAEVVGGVVGLWCKSVGGVIDWWCSRVGGVVGW